MLFRHGTPGSYIKLSNEFKLGKFHCVRKPCCFLPKFFSESDGPVGDASDVPDHTLYLGVAPNEPWLIWMRSVFFSKRKSAYVGQSPFWNLISGINGGRSTSVGKLVAMVLG